MSKHPSRARLLAGTFLCFGALTGLAGAAIYYDPTLLRTWMGPAFLGAPPILGLLLYAIARPARQIPCEPAPEATSSEVPVEETPDSPTEMSVREADEPAAKPEPEIPVVQIVGLLQREGRLLDFLQEDIEPYDDAQIGAAAREVHRGCRTALHEALSLAPVLSAAEGSEVEIEEDFDPTRVKLIGHVHGKPPYKGILRHCGWRYTELRLPQWTGKDKTDVLTPAEVEIM